jgi:hypothetical protein
MTSDPFTKGLEKAFSGRFLGVMYTLLGKVGAQGLFWGQLEP